MTSEQPIYQLLLLTSGEVLIILQVGFDAGDKKNFHQTSNSGNDSIINITSFTNVGIPGKMIFRLGVAGSNNTANQGIVTPGKIIIYVSTFNLKSTFHLSSKTTQLGTNISLAYTLDRYAVFTTFVQYYMN